LKEPYIYSMSDGMIGDQEKLNQELDLPLVAFRKWRIRGDSLYSPYADIAWFGQTQWPKDRPLLAECTRHAMRDRLAELRNQTLEEIKMSVNSEDVFARLKARGIVTAPESVSKERAPRRGCSCGIYAYPELSPREVYCGDNDLIGACLLSGKIIIHDKGLRAEKAEPLALQKRGLFDQKSKQIADAYQIPCFYSWRKLRSYAKQYGRLTTIEELLAE
jgi:hypothetical protein